ncbi:adenylosuccinate synthetase [Candidatus Bathyarchaeota archaeon]|nr:adenylosuccinate synthetase [Candidatus Bathyarchaeota archaeon]
MPSLVLVGGFYGDEGKGKIVSYLAKKDDYTIAVRGGVGPNAGHTIVWEGRTYRLRMLPSAFVNKKTRLQIGPGVLVNPEVFLKEVKELNAEKRCSLDPLCAIIEQKHIDQDKGSEYLSSKIGTTGTGTGPCNSDRINRVAKLARDFPELKSYLIDVPASVNAALANGENIIVEGTQGTFLSLFHGSYPFVTSKDVTASSIAADVGLGPTNVDDVLVVFKAYVTRVGEGFLKEELSFEEAAKRGWAEFGTVTRRQRRAAPFDYDLARRAVMLNGATQIAITNLDHVYQNSMSVTNYRELPAEAKSFIKKVEDETDVPVTLIGTGPSVEEVVDRREKIWPT